MASIDIRAVHKLYGRTAAVGGGESVVILGPSGCGKSTLLRMFAGHIHDASAGVPVALAMTALSVPPTQAAAISVPAEAVHAFLAEDGRRPGRAAPGPHQDHRNFWRRRMSREITFVHLTDLHIGDPSTDDHLFSDTRETLKQVLALVATIEPRPSFIVASGDLANRGDAESYAVLKGIMAATDLPVVYAIGNHDTREGFYAGMGVESERPDAPYFHDRVIDGIHILTLDSSTPGFIGGTIEPEQFDWLARVLDTHPHLPKLVVTHHPPALGEGADAAHWRHIAYEQSVRLGEMLKGRNIIGILSGHIHHDRVSAWNGIPVVVGMGQHAATDILRSDVLRMVRGSSFAIGTIRKSGLSVAFVPLPTDRAELNVYPLQMLLDRAAAVPVAVE